MFWKLIRSRALGASIHFWTFPSHPSTFKFQQNRRHGICSARDGARVVESSIGRHHQSSILQSQRSSVGVLMGQGMYHMLLFLRFHLLAIYSIDWCDDGSIQSVRLYDASANVLRGEFMHAGPVLDCCFHDDSSGFSVAADNTVRRSLTPLTLFFNFKPTCLSCSSPCDLVVLFFIPG